MNETTEEEVTEEEDQEGTIRQLWEKVTGDALAIGGALWSDVWSGLTEWIPSLGAKAFQSWKEAAQKQEEREKLVIDHFQERLTTLAPDLQDTIDDAKELPWPFGRFLSTYLQIWGPITLWKEKIRLSLLPAAYGAASNSTTEIPPLDVCLREWFRSPENRVDLADWLSQHNLGDLSLNTMLCAVQEFGSLEVILALRRRGVIATDEEAMVRIQKLGFTDSDAELVFNLVNVIPAIPDLIRFAVREAFNEEAVERFSLDDAYPAELTKWAQMQGLSETFAKAYWRAHWELPSISQGFEMLWRTNFSDADLDLLMQTADISPYFRPFLKAISYRPLTRVDVRRMYDLDVLGREQVKLAYKNIGYNEENAESMTEFTIRYAERSETADLAKMVIDSYRRYDLAEETAIEMLQSLFYTESQATLAIEKVKAEIAIELKIDETNRIQRLYTSRRITEQEASDMLDVVEKDPIRKFDLLGKWEVARKAKARYPTAKELDKYLMQGIITPEQWQIEMANLGFVGKYQDWRLSSLLKEREGEDE